MKASLYKMIAILFSVICTSLGYAQTQETNQSDPAFQEPLTIVYDIKINSKKQSTGIEQSYNGGIKTILSAGPKIRVRLVSLMRIQSIYFLQPDSGINKIIVCKESGHEKYKFHLTAQEWKQVNKKYAGNTCIFSNDSIMIAGYYCKRVTIHLTDGKSITAYYNTTLPSMNKLVDPMFACVPGIVLRYEYAHENGTIIFNASKISRVAIDESVFKEPGKEYILKKGGVQFLEKDGIDK